MTAESQLPGLSAWNRVRDYREAVIAELPNVEVFRESPMTAEDVVEFDFQHVIVATGAAWRTDGVGRWHTTPIPVAEGALVLGPDDIFAGRLPEGRRIVVYDDDYYYMGGVIAEQLRRKGYQVAIVTPATQVSPWTVNTFEVTKIQRRLIDAGIERITEHAVTRVGCGGVVLVDAYARRTSEVEADAVVMVTARLPRDELFLQLDERRHRGELATVRGVGDCWAPATIAAAVWSGRRAAEEFDAPVRPNDEVPFRREVTELALLAEHSSAGIA